MNLLNDQVKEFLTKAAARENHRLSKIDWRKPKKVTRVEDLRLPMVLKADGIKIGSCYEFENDFSEKSELTALVYFWIIGRVAKIRVFDAIRIIYASATRLSVIVNGAKLEGLNKKLSYLINLDFMGSHRLGFDTESVFDMADLRDLGLVLSSSELPYGALDGLNAPIPVKLGDTYPIHVNGVLNEKGNLLFRWMLRERITELDEVISALGNSSFDSFSMSYLHDNPDDENEVNKSGYYVILRNSVTGAMVGFSKHGLYDVNEKDEDGSCLSDIFGPKESQGVYSTVSGARLNSLAWGRFIDLMKLFNVKVKFDDAYPDDGVQFSEEIPADDETLGDLFRLAVDTETQMTNAVKTLEELHTTLPEIPKGEKLTAVTGVGNLVLFMVFKGQSTVNCTVALKKELVAISDKFKGCDSAYTADACK